MPKSFREYVVGRRKTDTPEGDFVVDAKSDKAFPDARTWEEVEKHLRMRRAAPEAIEAGRNVWRQYRARHGRH